MFEGAKTKFGNLLEECARINPPSLTGQYQERIEDVTKHGLDNAPTSWNGKHVLIIGCGDGFEVDYAVGKLGWDAFGLTFLKGEMSSLYAGLKEQDRKRIWHGDMHSMPFSRDVFDCVYSKETLEHSPCPFLVLCEINRVLKTGGEFFHLIPHGWNKQRDWYHYSAFPAWIWSDLMRKAYLQVESVTSQPDCDKCTFDNIRYFGRKIRNRVILGESMESYKENLKFTHTQSSEGLI